VAALHGPKGDSVEIKKEQLTAAILFFSLACLIFITILANSGH
jgi:hypothetical protein